MMSTSDTATWALPPGAWSRSIGCDLSGLPSGKHSLRDTGTMNVGKGHAVCYLPAPTGCSVVSP